MKKTVTRLESRMSSIWDLPVRAFAGVKRLVLIVRMRWASSRMATSSLSVTVAVSRKYLNSAPARPPTILRRFSVNAFEPVRWSVLRPRSASSATRLRAMTDLPVPGPPSMRKTTFCWFCAGVADRVEDRVVGDELLVEEHEGRLVADDAGDVVEQALVRLEGGRGDALEDLALVRAGDALVEEGREARPTGRRRTTGSCRAASRSRRGRAATSGRAGRSGGRRRRRARSRGRRRTPDACPAGSAGTARPGATGGGVARPAAVVDGDAVGDVRAADLGPLLELDDDGGVALRVGVRAGDEDVEPLRGERHLELDEDPLVGQVGDLEDVRHRARASFART